MRILVTGASGVIGQLLVKQLGAIHSVVSLSRKMTKDENAIFDSLSTSHADEYRFY